MQTSTLSATNANATYRVLALFLALAVGASMSAYVGVAFGRSSLPPVIMGLVIGMIISLAGGILTLNEQIRNRDVLGGVGVLGIPVMAIFVGIAGGSELFSFGIGLLVMSGISWAMSTTLLDWALSDNPVVKQSVAQTFRLGSGLDSNPIPGSVILGILLFGLPFGREIAPFFCFAYFASLIGIASVGGAIARLKASGVQKMAMAPGTIPRWLLALATLLIISLVGGVAGPFLTAGSMTGFSPEAQNAPFGLRPDLSAIPKLNLPGVPEQKSEGSAKMTQQDPAAPESTQAQPARPGPPNPPPPEQPQDFNNLILILLLIGAMAAALLWIARKHGEKIQSFLSQFWIGLLAPWHRYSEQQKQRRKTAEKEAALAKIREQIGNVYRAYDAALNDDSAHAYRQYLAYSGVLGVTKRTSETPMQHLHRLGTVQGLDRSVSSLIVNMTSKAAFGGVALTEKEKELLASSLQKLEAYTAGQYSQERFANLKASEAHRLAEDMYLEREADLERNLRPN